MYFYATAMEMALVTTCLSLVTVTMVMGSLLSPVCPASNCQSPQRPGRFLLHAVSSAGSLADEHYWIMKTLSGWTNEWGPQTSPPPLARTGTLSARAILYEPPTFWDLSLQIGNVAKASVSLDVTWSGLSVDKPGTLQTMNNARMLIGGERVLW